MTKISLSRHFTLLFEQRHGKNTSITSMQPERRKEKREVWILMSESNTPKKRKDNKWCETRVDRNWISSLFSGSGLRPRHHVLLCSRVVDAETEKSPRNRQRRQRVVMYTDSWRQNTPTGRSHQSHEVSLLLDTHMYLERVNLLSPYEALHYFQDLAADEYWKCQYCFNKLEPTRCTKALLLQAHCAGLHYLVQLSPDCADVNHTIITSVLLVSICTHCFSIKAGAVSS